LLKLLLHLALATTLWFSLWAMGFAIAWRIAAIVLGVFAVHWIWESVALLEKLRWDGARHDRS
jgi:hypothetical protein